MFCFNLFLFQQVDNDALVGLWRDKKKKKKKKGSCKEGIVGIVPGPKFQIS